MRKLLAVCLITMLYQNAMANREEKIAYIQQFSPIAIQEMHRSGIPASIKLAQALLESNAGKSMLAKGSNNHFGIKCGGKWDGKKMYVKDDDYKNGKLIKSCFRSYKNPESSFIAHTDFLMNQPRYASLFNLKKSNYKAWAKGLKKAGYATDPNYAHRLISIIESYQLFQFDKSGNPDHSYQPLIFAGEVDIIDYDKSVQFINNVRSVLAEDSYSVEDIALNHGVSVRQLLKYNEHLRSANQILYEGEIIYLQPKRSNYRGKQKIHRVRDGETMQFIAQKYGIKLKSLYKKNRMMEGSQPKIGSSLQLRGKVSKRKAPRAYIPKESSNIVRPNIPSNDQKPNSGGHQIEHKAYIEPSEKPKSIESNKELFYTVKNGDTLYGLSKKFNITVTELKQLNLLDSNQIQIGQKLRVTL